MCFPVNISKVLGAVLFIESPQWLLLNSVLVFIKEFKEKKVSGETARALISLFLAQM